VSHHPLLTRWLARPWILTLWCVLAAFGAYACMYGFRKPFTAAGFGGAETKAWLVTAQVIGYMLSKFIGIKVIAEMTPAGRARAFLGLIAIAHLVLLFFAIVPAPFDAVCLFINGLALGMVFGLVLGFVEGRCMTEMFVAGLCASFILADGVTKSAGALLLQSGISERWMPFTAGLIFLLPLLVFVWMLKQIPPPTQEDEAARSQRTPMTSAERIAFLRRHGLALLGIVLAYLLITILRSLRADFAPEIWGGLGHASPPAVFTQSELWVTLVVVIVNGALVLVKDNRRAFFTGLLLSITGLCLGLLALWAHHQVVMPPFAFMVLLGVGMYVPYVAVHTTLFERFIALTRERGNLGFLMYLADAIGYLGYVGVMLAHGLFPGGADFLGFFVITASLLLLFALLLLLVSVAVCFKRLPTASEELAPAATNP
jgi:Family of unknown function (DUF5690)